MQGMSIDKLLRDYIGEAEFKEMTHGMVEFFESLGKIQPWTDFFAVFKPPQMNSKYLEQRVTTNLVHYRSNYIIICIILTVIQLIFSPLLLLTLLIFLPASFYFLIIMKPSYIKIGEITITSKGKRYILLTILILLLGITGAFIKILLILLSCIIICFLHMIFRPRSVTAQANKAYENIKINGFTWPGSNTTNDNSNNKDNRDPENPPDGDGHNNSSLSSFGVTSENMRQRRPSSASNPGGK